MTTHQPRSLFDTTTAKGALISGLAGLVVSIIPSCTAIAQRSYPGNEANIKDIADIAIAIGSFVVVGGTGLTLAGRANAKSLVYTPEWMAGYNKEELIEAYQADPITDPPRIPPDESAIAHAQETIPGGN